MRKRWARGRGGFSIVEVLISMAVIAIFSFAMYGALSQLQMQKSRVDMKGSEMIQLNDIIESIRGSLDDYEITFDGSDETREKMLEVSKLPMAWDKGRTSTAEACPQCTGRYGFVIQPYSIYKGLYIFTIRFTNTTWNGNPAYKDYQFIVTLK